MCGGGSRRAVTRQSPAAISTVYRGGMVPGDGDGGAGGSSPGARVGHRAGYSDPGQAWSGAHWLVSRAPGWLADVRRLRHGMGYPTSALVSRSVVCEANGIQRGFLLVSETVTLGQG